MGKNDYSIQNIQSRRPYFNPHQQLTAAQLNAMQAFHTASLQRVLHGLAGSGVVYGFSPCVDENGKLLIKKGCIEIGCGLAFDHHGRQLYWPGGWIGIDDLAGDKPVCEGEYTLCAHYAEYREIRSSESKGCGSCDHDTEDVLWIDQRVVFTLKKGCDKKKPDCNDTWKRCPDINNYVCEHIDQTHCRKNPENLCPTQCDGQYYDPNHGIPLACVKICEVQDIDQCKYPFVFSAEAPKVCDVRQFVYRNELLYQLIRGDHQNYAYVASLSWEEWILYNKEWDTTVPWDKFIARVKRDEKGEGEAEGFTITFSKPIQTRTLHLGSIILSAVTQEARTDYWESRRIPLKKVDPLDEFTIGVHKYTFSVRLQFEDNWQQSEIGDQRSTLEYGAIIELTIRGSLLRDECGCMLNARPLGYENSEHHCCQSIPGGDFIALFRVAPREQGAALPGYQSYIKSAE